MSQEAPLQVAGSVQAFVNEGWTVVHVGPAAVTLERGRPVNHVLHLLLTLATCGFWALPWLIIGTTGGVKRTRVIMPPAVKVDWGD